MNVIRACLLVLVLAAFTSHPGAGPGVIFSFPPLPPTPTVAVVSSGTPSLNGTYTMDANAVGNITAIVSGIAANQGFPGGTSTFVYLDAAGQPHTFPNTAEFVAFGAAIRNYVYAMQMVSMGQTATAPTVPLTIP